MSLRTNSGVIGYAEYENCTAVFLRLHPGGLNSGEGGLGGPSRDLGVSYQLKTLICEISVPENPQIDHFITIYPEEDKFPHPRWGDPLKTFKKCLKTLKRIKYELLHIAYIEYFFVNRNH